jgi:uncharacterized protein (TIGR02646 family)
MRSFERPGFAVPTLDDTGPAGRKRQEHRNAFEQRGEVPEDFEEYWNNPDVRGLLHAMQSHVCAYCGLESRALDVEHFRPKGKVGGREIGYWWLAYEATNYFLGCTSCNQKRKRTSFPLTAGAERVTFPNRHLLSAEVRVLFDPVEDRTLEDWFAIEWNDVTCRLIPAKHLTAQQKDRVHEVIDLFDLNGDATVRTRRSKLYEEAIRAANDKRWEDVRRLAMRHREHSFAARFVLAELDPAWLPTARDELEDLVRVLWEHLSESIREIRRIRARGKRPAVQNRRQASSYCWALIVLQAQTPPGLPGLVPELLAELLRQEREEAVREEILKEFRQLSGR